MMGDEDFGWAEGDGEAEEAEDEDKQDEPVETEEAIGDQLAGLAALMDAGDGVPAEEVAKDFSSMTKADKLQIVNQCVPMCDGKAMGIKC